MADISEWSPTDDANTNAPPNGWPEFMQPSAVNNSARALMGAVRRWYDTITAQLTGINAAIGTKVNRAGDTMTGGLAVNTTAGGLALNKPAAGNANEIWGQTGSSARWLIQMGGNDENFWLHRYNDAGGYLGYAFHINRTDGAVSVPGNVVLGTGASAAAHATRKDYVDQRDNDWYNAAWTNISGWAAGQDQYYYNAAVNNSVAKTGGTMTGGLSVPSLVIYDGLEPFWTFTMDSSFKYQTFISGFYWAWDRSNGTLYYAGTNSPNWVMRNTDGLTYNAKANVAGYGDYLNLSDRRSKDSATIAPATAGLPEILQLEPVEFKRLSRESLPSPQWELGFVAQDVAAVLPQAVSVAGIELPDGSGGLSDPEPTLGVTSGAIVAAMVNAIKTLEARLADLEATRTGRT